MEKCTCIEKHIILSLYRARKATSTKPINNKLNDFVDYRIALKMDLLDHGSVDVEFYIIIAFDVENYMRTNYEIAYLFMNYPL